jgi:hypothetical protein
MSAVLGLIDFAIYMLYTHSNKQTNKVSPSLFSDTRITAANGVRSVDDALYTL